MINFDAVDFSEASPWRSDKFLLTLSVVRKLLGGLDWWTKYGIKNNTITGPFLEEKKWVFQCMKSADKNKGHK